MNFQCLASFHSNNRKHKYQKAFGLFVVVGIVIVMVMVMVVDEIKDEGKKKEEEPYHHSFKSESGVDMVSKLQQSHWQDQSSIRVYPSALQTSIEEDV